MSDNDLDSEEGLRAHIRNLLLDYALTHLTTDYIEFTENLVNELLAPVFKPIPTSDPNALYRPLDPLQKLARIYQLDLTTNANSNSNSTTGVVVGVSIGVDYITQRTKLEVGKEHIAYLKSKLVGPLANGVKTRSERAVWEEGKDEEEEEEHYEHFRPMTPVLTLKARRETPQPGSGRYRPTFKHKDLPFVAVEEEPLLDQNAILNVKWTRKKEEETAYRQFINAVPAMLKFDPNRPAPYQAFLDGDDDDDTLAQPPPPIMGLDPFSEVGFVPIFSRRERRERRWMMMEGSEDLVKWLPEVEVSSDTEEEIRKGNLAVVNGWEAYVSSPISSLSRSSQERDELVDMRISSPDTEPFCVEVDSSKMDVPIMPRTKRIYGGETPVPKIGDGQRLGAFLTPYVTLNEAIDAPPQPDDLAEESVLAHPPTHVPESAVGREGYRLHDDDQLDDEIRSMYRDAPLGYGDGMSFIMQEKLDIPQVQNEVDGREGDRSTCVIEFMDVPNLPEPNVHPAGPHSFLKTLKDFLDTGPAAKGQGKTKSMDVFKFLKKVKGIQALNVTLPWTPYIARFRIPTQLEMARVDNLFSAFDPEDQAIPGYSAKDRAKIEELLRSASIIDQPQISPSDSCAYIQTPTEELNVDVDSISKPWENHYIVLTRVEREAKRMRRMKLAVGGGGDEGVDRKSVGKRTVSPYFETRRGVVDTPKRRKTEMYEERGLEDSGVWFVENGDEEMAVDANRQDDGGFVNEVPESRGAIATHERFSLPPSSLSIRMDDDEPGIANLEQGYLGPRAGDDDDYAFDDFDYADFDFAFKPDEPVATGGHAQPQDASFSWDDSSDLWSSTPAKPAPIANDNKTYGTDAFPESAAFSIAPPQESTGVASPSTRTSFQPALYRSSQTAPAIPAPSGAFDTSKSRFKPTESRSSNSQPRDLLRTPLQTKTKTTEVPIPTLQSSSPASFDLNNLSTSLSNFGRLRFLDFAPSTYDAIEAQRKLQREEELRRQEERQETLKARPKGPPPDLIDDKTLDIPRLDYFVRNAGTPHKYLASLDVIQLRGLVNAFKSNPFNTTLVDRNSLGTTTMVSEGGQDAPQNLLPGVDLILDPQTAVVLVSLFSLPARVGELVKRISEASWRFSHILVVFQAFPEGQAKSIASSSNIQKQMGGIRVLDAPYAYTPPILKAVKKLKLDLDIAEGMGTMRGESTTDGMGTSTVRWCFASNVEEVVCSCRRYADEAEARTLCASSMLVDPEEMEMSGGSVETPAGWVWGSRVWLDGDVSEEEDDLASLPGMNHFSASIVLSIVNLQGFLDLTNEERLDTFGGYIGNDVLMRFNEWLEHRTRMMEETGGVDSVMT